MSSIIYETVKSQREEKQKSIALGQIFSFQIFVDNKKVGPVPGTHKIPSTSGSHGPPGPAGPLEPWEITSIVWNSESKHPETLKLKHKQRTLLNYITGQSQTKAGNCVYLLKLFYLSSC